MLAAVLDTLALTATGAFAGVALCSTLVDVHAMLEMHGPGTVMFFRGWYTRLRKLQMRNILAGSACSILRVGCCATQGPLLVAHVFNVVALWGIFCFTVKFMLPGNMELLAMARRPEHYSEQQCRVLIQAWGRLHLFRTAASSVAFLGLALAGFMS